VTTADLDAAIHTLARLGFSPYEAKTYIGLVKEGPQTGYALSKATGVPQPKVYETLRRLEARGAALKLAGEPVRYVAVAPEQLLEAIGAEHARAVAEARVGLANLTTTHQGQWQGVQVFDELESAIHSAKEAIAAAHRRIYISAQGSELALLEGELSAAADRGVDLIILYFGTLPPTLRMAHAYGHHSTDGTIYRHHQARHLALVVDSEQGVWGLAPDGANWSTVVFDDEFMVSLIKGYIRHDLYFQRVYDDFGPQLTERYGRSLEALNDYYRAAETAEVQPRPDERRHA
jgi:sugar-specific transcriptional regulator TrmB